jgi:hypothetical protein
VVDINKPSATTFIFAMLKSAIQLSTSGHPERDITGGLLENQE